ncbi:acyltransferase [Anaerospora hongkongensis]|uniref:acyltransferase n=1 Tax=Anaerospora hongkongensis TaxID=244830 RepID=UPI0028A24CDB|nr:acyltransferase [Anaerospora hongkongensis]
MDYFTNLYYMLKTMLYYRIFFKSIGRKSIIRRPLLLLNTQYIDIGERVFIRDNVRLEVVCLNNKIPQLSIGHNTNIEQNVHIICHDSLKIGRDVSITANCAIVDVTHPYNILTEKIGTCISSETSKVIIGDGTFIGIGSVILPNVIIGKRVVIGANSVVTKDIPDYSIAVGNPARVIKRFNLETGKWEKVAEL